MAHLRVKIVFSGIRIGGGQAPNILRGGGMTQKYDPKVNPESPRNQVQRARQCADKAKCDFVLSAGPLCVSIPSSPTVASVVKEARN